MRPWLSWLPLLLLSAAACAGAATPEQIEHFERKVRPVLAARCFSCHSSQVKTAFAGLRLDTQAGLMKGSDMGPVVMPGDVAASRLLQAVRGELKQRMPPAGKLSDPEIAALEKWIADGAAWPAGTAETAAAPASGGFDLEKRRREHWAWQPLRRPPPILPPAAASAGAPANPVDRFLAAARAAKSLQPAARADALTLLRRAAFDLTGLPPAVEDIAAFTRDSSPAAFERYVDRALSSPQFGERLARRWMDLVRYTESHGSEGDPDVPQAWRYRDYLIRAFNNDVPYDQLLREHLAGDLLSAPRLDTAAGLNESLIGAAHWRMVEHGFQPVDPWEDRVKWADNQIDVFSKAFQGLTISCARCHDHKFDAISQRDFYALFGVLAGARPTQVAIDAPARLNTNRTELAVTRRAIKQKLVEAWLAAAGAPLRIAARLDALAGEKSEEDRESITGLWKQWRASSEPRKVWEREASYWRGVHAKPFSAAKGGFDVRQDYGRWTRHGTGAPAAASPPGEFAVAPSGRRAIHGIYPSGVYSHLLSSKHNAVVASPRFKVDSKWISFRVLGGNFSNVNLIIENYAVPRGGIYNLRFSPKVDKMGWARWDATFWKGFSAYIEFATYEDVTHFALDEEQARLKPRPAAPRDGRSWFGVQQVVFHDQDDRPREEPVPAAALLAAAPGAESVDDVAGAIRRAVEAWRDTRLTEEQAVLLDWLVRHDVLPVALDDVEGLRDLVEDYRRLEEQVPVARRAPGVVDEAGPDQRLLVRGNHNNLGEAVPRRYLSALAPAGGEAPVYDDPRLMRLRLAEAVASPANPLTARVMVNRIWQWMFRRGLVGTVDNFGKLGHRPTHPELLDYLAQRFIDEGWSIKRLLRLLATSEAYQMSSAAASPRVREEDAANLLLTRQNARRLEAEEIRDAVLAASGELDDAMYGPSIETYYAHDTGKTKGDKAKGPLDGRGRRSVYLEVRRNVVHPFLEVFDVPKPASTRGQRDVTTVPAQSLALLNSEFIVDQSRKWARRLAASPDAHVRVERIFLNALGRPAVAVERDQALSFIASLAAEYSSADPLDERKWQDLAQSVFNFKEFLYVR